MKDLFYRLGSARDGALRVLLAVEREQAYANLVLRQLLTRHHLSRKETALLTELVNGTLRMRGNIDYVIDCYSTTPVIRMHSTIRNIVRLGVYQLLFLERIPAAAAVNESVKLVKEWKMERLAGFVNGVLRSVARNKGRISYPSPVYDLVRNIAVCHSHPEWLVRRWLERFGREETIALCQADNAPPPLCLRCNTLKISPPRLIEQLAGEGVTATPSHLVPEGIRAENLTGLTGLSSFREGLYVLQDESSMLASLVLKPEPGSLVIDACSGPGGKATHLAQLMENRGRILAFDLHPHRLGLIRETAARLGITIITTAEADAGSLPVKPGEADYLLVDAPCSGLGVLRRRPDLRWRVGEEDLPPLVEEQLRILRGSSRCLKPGGMLLYSTCSTEPEENDGVVDCFLKETNAFEPVGFTERLPFPLVEKGDQESVRYGRLQLLPHRHNTDGFFLALMRKVR